jgi:hypothetical protein
VGIPRDFAGIVDNANALTITAGVVVIEVLAMSARVQPGVAGDAAKVYRVFVATRVPPIAVWIVQVL